MEKIIINTKTKINASKKYRTILADPPWNINQKGNYGAVNHYDLMKLEQIKVMPVADLAEETSLKSSLLLSSGFRTDRTWSYSQGGVHPAGMSGAMKLTAISSFPVIMYHTIVPKHSGRRYDVWNHPKNLLSGYWNQRSYWRSVHFSSTSPYIRF